MPPYTGTWHGQRGHAYRPYICGTPWRRENLPKSSATFQTTRGTSIFQTTESFTRTYILHYNISCETISELNA
eukprot:2699016-Pyramimonas_sp.AAC.1